MLAVCLSVVREMGYPHFLWAMQFIVIFVHAFFVFANDIQRKIPNKHHAPINLMMAIVVPRREGFGKTNNKNKLTKTTTQIHTKIQTAATTTTNTEGKKCNYNNK